MKRLAAIAIVAVLACAPAVAGASTRAQTIARLNQVVAQVQALNTPGGVIGVTGDGIGRYQRAFGEAAPGVPMTANSEFRIASITKTFTATVILELVDRGKLKLNDTIDRWEPRLPYARVVTIRQLLNMTSSIFDEGGAGSLLVQWQQQNCVQFRPSTACGQTYWSPQSIIDLAIQQGAQFLPGIYNYSDTNYVLLAMIAQAVTHKPYWLLLKQLITGPLHLRHTFYPTSTTAMPAPATVGYQMYTVLDKKKNTTFYRYAPGPQPNPSLLGGAGAIISNVGDLQVWAKALGTGALLKPQTQRLRLQLMSIGTAFIPLAGTFFDAGLPLSYGLGIAGLGGLLGHNGAQSPLYTSEMWYSPKRHGSVVVLYNSLTLCPTFPAGTFELADETAVSLARIAYGASLSRVGIGSEPCQSAQPLGSG
jgi:CubicO group peptidase (beta-lactamase class C family)